MLTKIKEILTKNKSVLRIWSKNVLDLVLLPRKRLSKHRVKR